MFLNQVAVFVGFCNFVLNAAIAFVIWWRVLRPDVDIEHLPIAGGETLFNQVNDKVFKLVGLLFSSLALSYLLVAMLRAHDIDLISFTVFRIICGLVAFLASLFAMYVILGGKLRIVVPVLIGGISVVSSFLYTWLSV